MTWAIVVARTTILAIVESPAHCRLELARDLDRGRRQALRVQRGSVLALAERGPTLGIEPDQYGELVSRQSGIAMTCRVHVDAERTAGDRARDQPRGRELAAAEVSRAVCGSELEDPGGQGRARDMGEQPSGERLLSRCAARPPQAEPQVPGYSRGRIYQQAGREQIRARRGLG